jgi:GNAT superfamily N-acetyltransferase
MHLRSATESDTDAIIDLAHTTIRASYPPFYPAEAIDYFLAYHCIDNVGRDIRNGNSVLLLDNGKIVGTGTLSGTNIHRVFIPRQLQGRGYGSLIMDFLEKRARDGGNSFVELHASLPAIGFYVNRHYTTLKFCRIPVANNLTLDYHRMARMVRLPPEPPAVDLNGKRFRSIPVEGSGAGAVNATLVTFYQREGMVMGVSSGGELKEGEIIGFIEDATLRFHYEFIDYNDGKRDGDAAAIIEPNEHGKLRLIPRGETESRFGPGLLQEE